MANYHPAGSRNVALPEENQPSWRPEDEPMAPEDERRRHARRAERSERGDWAQDPRDGRPWRGRGLRDDREYSRGAWHHGDERWRPQRGPDHDRDAALSAGSFVDRYRGEDRHRGEDRDPDSYWLDRRSLAGDRGHDRSRDLSDDLGQDLGPAGGYRGRDFGPERQELSRGYDRGRGDEERTGYPADYGRGDERLGYPAGSYGRRGSRIGGESQRGSWIGGESQRGSVGLGRADDRVEGHVHRGTGPHRGKGPNGYQRSDERIRELVCESLTEDDQIDASHVEVSVSHGEVTLSGTVEDRRAKREAEDCACSVLGVRDVQNLLRVDDGMLRGNPAGAASVGTGENGRQRELGTDTVRSKHRA